MDYRVGDVLRISCPFTPTVVTGVDEAHVSVRWPWKESPPTGCATPPLTWVERYFGYGVARAYAGHTDSTGPATYIKADLNAVAAALAAMTGQPHPLAAVADRASGP